MYPKKGSCPTSDFHFCYLRRQGRHRLSTGYTKQQGKDFNLLRHPKIQVTEPDEPDEKPQPFL